MMQNCTKLTKFIIKNEIDHMICDKSSPKFCMYLWQMVYHFCNVILLVNLHGKMNVKICSSIWIILAIFMKIKHLIVGYDLISLNEYVILKWYPIPGHFHENKTSHWWVMIWFSKWIFIPLCCIKHSHMNWSQESMNSIFFS